jgi:hypothetical protein
MIISKKTFSLLAIFFGFFCSGQNLYLKFNFLVNTDKPIVDSILLKKKHENLKSITTEIKFLQNKFYEKGYINSNISFLKKSNDSTFLYEIALKKRIQNVGIYIGKNNKQKLTFLDANDLLIVKIRFTTIKQFLEKTTNFLQEKGFSQVNVQLVNFEIKNNELFCDLKIDEGLQRNIDNIIFSGYDKLPKNIKKNILKKYKNTSFSVEKLNKFFTDLNQYRFFSQSKYPEMLFAKDSTTIYAYVEKTKANRFDGLIGFSNNADGQLIFNGFLDLLMLNTLNAGEHFQLIWKSDGNRQTNFDTAIEVPYLFGTKLIAKAHLNIFKQDSIFQNTKTNINLGYIINSRSKIFIGSHNIESTSIQKTNAAVPNFKQNLTTLKLDYLKLNQKEANYYNLFQEKSFLNLNFGVGNRTTSLEKTSQMLFEINTMYNFQISEKLFVQTKNQTFFLNSKNYISSELTRFGGINSIRGFNENSLQANTVSALINEIRYVVSPSLYAYSALDFAYFEDKTTTKKGFLTGFGLGFGLLTKSGLLNIIYANGQSVGQNTDFGNSIVHLRLKVGF